MHPDTHASIIEKNSEIGIIQFGEGNFLRAFANWMVHVMHTKGTYHKRVALVQPIPSGRIADLAKVDGRYHHVSRSASDAHRPVQASLIDVFEAFVNPYEGWQSYLALARNPHPNVIISNTTEAGIEFDPTDAFGDIPGESFPAKLTQLLFERYRHHPGKGFHILPCELIDGNGDKLKSCVLDYVDLWGLEPGFKEWIFGANFFYNTLVDRIVPGHPNADIDTKVKQLAETDPFCVASEAFHLWVIEGSPALEKVLPFQASGLNIVYTDDLPLYRTRKVRILNGSHMALVAMGFFYKLKTVREAVLHPAIAKFLSDLLDREILPALPGDSKVQREYADIVLERFENPFIEHKLQDISLNSFAKLRSRILPSILDYCKVKGEYPKRLLSIIAAFVCMYENLDGFTPRDAADVEDKINRLKAEFPGDSQLKARMSKHFGDETLWGPDALVLSGMADVAFESYFEFFGKRDALLAKKKSG